MLQTYKSRQFAMSYLFNESPDQFFCVKSLWLTFPCSEDDFWRPILNFAMAAAIITFEKALKVYKELKLGSYVKKGVSKAETTWKAVLSILQVYDFEVNDEPKNASAVSTFK